jgi:hypothetical protein
LLLGKVGIRKLGPDFWTTSQKPIIKFIKESPIVETTVITLTNLINNFFVQKNTPMMMIIFNPDVQILTVRHKEKLSTVKIEKLLEF